MSIKTVDSYSVRAFDLLGIRARSKTVGEIMNQDLIEKMLDVGLNRYESKAYLSLLQNRSVTAYEIAKISGVPQSKIYETMERLLKKNLVNVVDDNPVKYIALNMDNYIDNYRKNIGESIAFIKEGIEEISPKRKVSHLLHITGRDNVDQQLRTMLGKVKEFAYLEIWDTDYEEIYRDVEKLVDAGKEVVIVLYGEVKKEVGKVYHHEMEGLLNQKRSLGRWMTLVVDGKESLFSIENDEGVQGIWTENESFMVMAEAFIAHDIFLAEIYKRYREDLDRDFGPNLQKIREHIKIR